MRKSERWIQDCGGYRKVSHHSIMNILITILILLTPLISYGQWVQDTIIEYNGESYYLYEAQDSTYLNTPFKSYHKYDSLGNFLSISEIFPKDGKWISFYKQDKSKVASVFHVKNKKLNGPSMTFRYDGTKELELHLTDNVKNGYWIFWHANGQISTINFYKNVDFGYFQQGVPHGTFQSWYPNGQLLSTMEYRDGIIIDKSIQYYENGNPKMQSYYIEGELNGDYILFHENGNIYKHLTYLEGVAFDQDTAIYYHPNGYVSETGRLVRGQNCENWKYYTIDGKLMSEGKWEIVTYEHEHGDFTISVKADNWKFYYPSGQIMAKGNYNIDKERDRYFDDEYESFRDDSWVYYNESGQEISRHEFDKSNRNLVVHVKYDD